VTGSRRPDRTRGRTPALVLVLVLAMMLCGCVSVPSTGPVVEGRPAGEPVPPPNVAVIPAPPRPDDTPEEIAEGFLTAMASYEPGYPTAREFLTPQAAATWDPASGMLVYAAAEGSRRVTETAGTVRAVLPLEGTVSADGTYTASAPDTTATLDLRMEQVDGQWRLATPPAGLVMSAFDFRREFASFSSYFYAPTGDVLVPDLTYLPVQGNLPTLLVEAVLDGPSTWLAPAVRSAVGPGVTLTSGAVTVSATTARVDLTDQVAAASAQQRERIAAQLAWTLRQAAGVTEVALLAEGTPLPLPSSDTGVVSTDAYDFLDPAAVPAGDQLFAVAGGAVVAVRGSSLRQVDGPLGQPGQYRAVGVNLTGTQAAAVSSDGSAVLRAGLSSESGTVPVLTGTDLSTPSVDRQDRVWAVDRDGRGSQVLVAGPETAPAVVVPADALDATRVSRLVVAPDGVRAAVVYERDGGSRLALALVLVGTDGSLSIGGLRDLQLEQLPAVDVAWASATALAALAGPAEGAQPYLVELADGALSSRGQVDGATSLAASPGQALVVGTSDGQLLRQDALLEWEPAVTATAPTYPG